MGARIAFLGDTLLGGQAQATLDRHGYEHATGGLAPVLADADLVVANLEGPVTATERPAAKDAADRKRYWYRAHPESLAALSALGVRLVSLANNHVLDHGAEGLADTIAALDGAGIAHCGAGADERAARRPVTLDVPGGRVGFLSALQRYRIELDDARYAGDHRPGPLRLRSGRIADDLAAVDADLRVALVHWGHTYRPVSGRQRRLAAALLTAGADLVVGHHPHVVQPVELDRGRPVLYSLGNGVFGTPGRFAQRGCPAYGMVAVVELDDSPRVTALELRLIDVDNRTLDYRPVLADEPAARRLLTRLASPAPRWRSTPDGYLRTQLVDHDPLGALSR